MHRFAGPSHRRWLRLCVWLLLGIVPLQGMSSILQQVLGRAHLHQAASEPFVLLDVVTRDGKVRFAQAPRSRVDDGHAHGVGSERHHHATSDSSVIYAEPTSTADDERSAGMMGFMPLPTGARGWPVEEPASDGRTKWASATWTSWHTGPADRPPRVRLG